MLNVDIEDGGSSGPRNTQDPVQFLLDCKEKGQNLSNKSPPSIYMIPLSVRDQKPEDFKPQVVSIGPLHRKDAKLQDFEDQKTIYLHHLLGNASTPSRQTLDTCLQCVNDSIHDIRKCYDGTIPYRDDELANMMVMDACFILGFLFLSKERHPLISRNPILTHSISRDLVLLENQIPFIVLQDIFNCTISKIDTCSLTSSVLRHFQFLIPFKGIKENNHVTWTTSQPRPPHHILGLLQNYFHPTHRIAPTCPPLKVPNHSALELDQAGVKFKPNSDDDGNHWPLAIDFSASSFESFRWCWGNRTLRMPTLHIDDNTELFLRNVIAYEQCTPGVPNCVTSYVCAIDLLIYTKKDLSMLVNSKVLSNNLGSKKDATKMLNDISKQFAFKEFYYKDQWNKLDNYCKSFVPKNVALLKRTYFSSPWTIIAVLAAIVLFTLVIIQTMSRSATYMSCFYCYTRTESPIVPQ